MASTTLRTRGGWARGDLPPFHITGALHKIPQGLVTEIERGHGSREGRKMKGMNDRHGPRGNCRLGSIYSEFGGVFDMDQDDEIP